MPSEAEENKYAPLTAEEKKAILARHKELVDRFNASLPDNMKLAYDDGLEERLDDPKVYGVHRIAQEMEEKRARQKAIQAELEARFGRSQQRPDPLSRAIFYEFDTSGTPEAAQYNERLYHDYLEDPGKVIAMQYRKTLNADPSLAYNADGDSLKMAEYYRDTYPICERAFVFQSVLSTGEYLTPEMKASLSSVVKPMEMIGHPVNMMRAAVSLDYIACPKLSLEQSILIQNTDRDLLLTSGDTFKRILDEPLVSSTSDTPKQFFGKFIERGQELRPGMFTELRPERYDLDNRGEPTNIQEVHYDTVFSANPDAHVRLNNRPAQNRFAAECMTKSFQGAFLKKWQEDFNKRRGYVGDFNIAQIENEHKGGFMERYILFSTSRQYKQYLQAFKEYNDPQSPNYLNKENLKAKGEAYLRRKFGNGPRNPEALKGTSKIRAKLVLASIEACDEGPTVDSVVSDMENAYKASEIKRVPCVSAKQVDINGEDLALQEPEKELEAQPEVSKGMNDPSVGN